jgi:MutS domain V
VADPRAEYQGRIERANDALRRGERRHETLANARLAVAAALAASLWLSLVRGAIAPAWPIASAAVFAALVVIHARVLHRNERTLRARRLYERGLDRIADRWSGAGADGARFLDDHLYARDLDLFGPGSLFQLLSTAKTEAGEDALARWLKSPASIDEVRARQKAVGDLAGMLDFREAVGVVAAEARVGRTSALGRWAALAPVGFHPRAGAVLLVLGASATLALPLGFAGLVPASVVAAALAAAGAAAWRWREAVKTVVHRVDAASDDLPIFRELVAVVEGASFGAPWLAAIRRRLTTGGEPSSARLARLERLASLLNQVRYNPFMRVVATPLLVESQLAVAIDRWHATEGQHLAGWLDAVGELEALSSLAAFAFEHPSDPFPDLAAAGAVFEAEGLAHPLIAAGAAVRNDVRLGGSHPYVYLVSGSNMSGKSTLLRSVGINVVLALAGAPVRASRMSVSPLAIGATVRVVDSLQEGYSRFYAEILRIRAIVALTSGPVPVLFLLDEILHGTNSYDRRIGAEAIVRALVEAGAIGLVTTHDLALTDLAAALAPRAVNVHFEDQIAGAEMRFDYRLRPGIVEHSNALALMRAIGIDV